MAGAAARFRAVDFVIRWLFSFALLLAIYNPTGYSFWDWLLIRDSEYTVVKVFVGLSLLLLLWFCYAMAIRVLLNRGIWIGMITAAMAAWALDNLGLLPRSWPLLIVMAQAAAAAWLAIGLSLSLVRAQISALIISVDEHH